MTADDQRRHDELMNLLNQVLAQQKQTMERLEALEREVAQSRPTREYPHPPGMWPWSEPGKPAAPKPTSPYWNVNQAAVYCGMEAKTIYNHHSAGNIKSVSQRPLLFTKEACDTLVTLDRSRGRPARKRPGKK